MFARLKSLLKRPTLEAAAQLAPVDVPKVKSGSQAFPSHMTMVKPSEAVIPKNDRRLQNTDVTTYRSGSSDHKVIRDFVSASPALGASVWYYLRLGIPENYTVIARSLEGIFDVEATRAAQSLLSRMDRITAYSDGFSGMQSLRSVSESMAKELIMFGGCAMELVLDKSRMPQRLQPLAISTIEFIQDGKMLRPQQRIGGTIVDLDIPTFFVTTLDQSLIDIYPESPIAQAVKPVIFSEDFFQDLHRVMKRTAFPRTVVSVDHEKFLKMGLSQEAQMNPELANQELTFLISSLESKLSSLRPEDAVVMLDTIGITTEASKGEGTSGSYQTLREIAESRVASGAKSLGAVLGHSGTGSQNIASTQTMLAVKSADSAIRMKLNEIYSRAFTLAIRLMGYDVEVTFAYEAIDLRPTLELESFKQSRQQRTLELLSLGFLSDEEAAIQLTGAMPPAGFKPLSGTQFLKGTTAATDIQNPSNSGSTLNQGLQKDLPPSTARGQNKDKGTVKKVSVP